MKIRLTIHLLTAIGASLIITACSKKNGDTLPKPTNLQISGRWDYTTDTVNSYVNGALVLSSNTGGIIAGDYEQFNTDGTGFSYDAGETTNFKYTVSGNHLTFNTPAQTIGGLQYPASTETGTIKQVTATTLYLYYDDKGSDSGGTYETTEAAHFTKQ